MVADGIGMRASQEARWKRNVKETRERQRRLQKIEKEKQEKEELKRKEALEQRRRDRADSDRHLRHPASQPPEPKKPILRKGTGAKRHGVRVKDVVRPTSPRTNAKQLQARLRDHIREQRQKVLLKKQSAADHGPGIEDDGIDWHTARKMAAERLDNLLHEVLPEAASDAATGTSDVQHSPPPRQHQTPPEAEEFTFPQPNHDLNALLAEMGPPKATQASAMQTIPAESTHGCESSSSQFRFGAGAPGPQIDDGAEQLQQGDELRRGVTTAARHRDPPRMWPFSQGELAEQEEPGQLMHQEPATACSDAATSSNHTHEHRVDQELPMPDWARLVDQSSSVKQSLSVEPHVEVPAWAAVVQVSCAATEHAAFDPSLSFPERDSNLSAVTNDKDVNITGQCPKRQIPAGIAAPEISMLAKTAVLESSRDDSSHTSVGDSAKSFDFGLASSGRVTASGNFQTGTEASPGDAVASKGKNSQVLQVSTSRRTVSRDAGTSIHTGDEPGPGHRECTRTAPSMSPVYPKEIQDPVKHSGIPLTGDREVDYAGLETQQTLLAEGAAKPGNRGGGARSPAMQPAVPWGILAQDQTKTGGPAPSHPKAPVIQQPAETERSASTKPASVEPSPGYADGMGVVRRHQPSLPRSDDTVQDLALTQHHKKSDDGIEGRRECKGSYAAAALAAQQREQRENHERERLAAELAKRRAAVAAREAKEKEAKQPPKTQQPRGHYASHVPGKAHHVPKQTPGPVGQDTPLQPGHRPSFYPPPAGMPAPNAWGAWPLPPPGYFAYPPAPPMPGMFVAAPPPEFAASRQHGSQKQAASPAPPQRKIRNDRAPKQVEKSEIEAVRQLEMSIEISDGEYSDEQELPEDWEAQVAAAAPSKSKRAAAREPGHRPQGDRPPSSNFSRSPLAAALLELVGLPGMHGMDPLTRQVSGRILASHGEPQRLGSARVCTGLSMEEDALLKSLQRIDPNMLRKSLKSAGIIVEEDGSILTSTKQEQDLLHSLEELDRRLNAVHMGACAQVEAHGHYNAQPSHMQQPAHKPDMQHGGAVPMLSSHSARKASRSPKSRIPKPERRASTSKGQKIGEGPQREDQAGYSCRSANRSAGKQAVSSRPSLNRNGKPTQPPEGYTIAHEYQQAPYSQVMHANPLMNGIPIQPHAMQQYAVIPGAPPNAIQGYVPPAYPGFPVYHQQGGQPPGVMIRPAERPSSELAQARQAHREKNYNQCPNRGPKEQAPSAATAHHGRIKMNKKMVGVLFE